MPSDSNLPRLPGSQDPGTRGRRGSGPSEVQEYLGILKRRWWLIAGAALLALAGAWWSEQGRTPVYTASVLLEQQREAPIMGMGISGSADFASQIEVIRSRAVVAAVVDSLGLQLQLRDPTIRRSELFDAVVVTGDARPGSFILESTVDGFLLRAQPEGTTLDRASPGEWLEGPGFRVQLAPGASLPDREPVGMGVQELQAAVERLQRRVRVEPGRAPGLVRVTYSDTDPRTAADVANGMASAYQAQRARMAREAAIRRREVIASQLVGLADSLEFAQQEVVAYQAQSQLLDPGYEGSQLMSSVLATESDLRTLRFQEGLLSSVVAGLQGPEASDESLNRILTLGGDLVPAGPELLRRLQDLEIERSRLTASRFGRTDGDPEVEVVDSLIASTKGQIRTAAEQGLDYLRVRREGAEERLGEMRSGMRAIPGQTAELSRLRQRADAIQDVVDALVDRFYEAQIAEAVEAGDIAVVDPAPVPLWPDGSGSGMTLLMGLVAGLIMGVGAALGIEYLNPRVRGVSDAEAVTGLPLLGVIPRMSPPSRDPVAAAIGKEAFRSLRTNIRFARASEPRILAVTSAAPKQGKTTVAVNLASTLAEQGPGRVLIMDGDLRRPLVHRMFSMDRGPGLTELLAGTVEADQAIHPSPIHPNLYVLPSGSQVPNPSAVTDSKAFSDLLEGLREEFDFVVIDTPPLLAVTDGAVIAKTVDGTLVVVRADRADPGAVAHAMDQLRQIDASLLGVILNGVGSSAGDGNYYQTYYQDYLADEATSTDRRRRDGRKRVLLGSGNVRE
jgi:polysaccharide biosynthesis transport protein